MIKKIFGFSFVLAFFISCASETIADKSVSVLAGIVPKDCKHVGVVSAENLMKDKAISGLKQMTYDLNGNFVKVVDEQEKGMMTILKGDAYLCK